MSFKTKFCSLHIPHTKFGLNKNMPNYNRFHVNCYIEVHYSNILIYVLILQCFFFIGSKVFVHLTLFKLLQIGQIYLKFFFWLENLIKIHLKYHKKYFWGLFFYNFTKRGIFLYLSITALSKEWPINMQSTRHLQLFFMHTILSGSNEQILLTQ